MQYHAMACNAIHWHTSQVGGCLPPSCLCLWTWPWPQWASHASYAHHHHHHMNHMQFNISSYKFLARLLFPHYAPDLRVNHMCRHNLVHPVKVIATVWDTVLVLCLTSFTKNWYSKCGEVAAPRWFRIKKNPPYICSHLESLSGAEEGAASLTRWQSYAQSVSTLNITLNHRASW